MPRTKPLHTKQEIPISGNPYWGKPIIKIIFCNVYKYKLEGDIVLDYFLLKYIIGNHHSLQLIKISFETNYIDQYERIIEDVPVLFTHSLITRTRFKRYTFITSGGGYSKTVGYKRTLNWFRCIYLVPSPHLSNIYKIVFLNQ